MMRQTRLTAGAVCPVVLIIWAVASAQHEAPQVAPPGGPDISARFDKLYAEWCAQRAQAPLASSEADTRMWFQGPAWAGILSLGSRAISHIMSKLPQDHVLGYALLQLTGFRYHIRRTGDAPQRWVWVVDEFPDLSARGGPPDATLIWRRWYTLGRDWVPQQFADIYSGYSDQARRGDHEAAQATLGRLADLGVAALPAVMERVRAGDGRLVVVAAELTNGALPRNSSPMQCLQWWEANKQDWLIPWPEQGGEE